MDIPCWTRVLSDLIIYMDGFTMEEGSSIWSCWIKQIPHHKLSTMEQCQAPVPLGRKCFPIVHDRDKFRWKCNAWLYIRIFTNVYPIIWRFINTVSEHFTDTLRTKQDSWGLIRQNENSFWKIRKKFKILYGWYQFLSDRSVSDCLNLNLPGILLLVCAC